MTPLSLTDNDKTAYLANLWLVARADNALSEREEALIEQARKSLSAKRSLATGAQKAAEGGSFSLTKVGSFADQVHNLEDMVSVALVDSDLNQREGDVIIAFCGLIGVRQDQLDLITSDVLKRLKGQASTINCSKCGAPVQSDARFCPTCGAAVATTVGEGTPLEFTIPKDGYAITFNESSAAGFASALELAKSIGSIQTALKNKKTWYLVQIGKERFVDVMRIAKALSGIRNRAIYLDGQQMEWDEMFGFVWCANQRDLAYKPIEYCFGKDENRLNPWGCKQVRMDWAEWSNWFSLGHWERVGVLSKRNVWVFDKERIRHNIATNIHRVRFCPYLHQTFIDAVLKSFPEKVEIADNGPWKYNVTYEETPGSIKIVEKEGGGDFSYTREYYADGVRPRGLVALTEIFEKAFSISRDRPEITPQSLLTK